MTEGISVREREGQKCGTERGMRTGWEGGKGHFFISFEIYPNPEKSWGIPLIWRDKGRKQDRIMCEYLRE